METTTTRMQQILQKLNHPKNAHCKSRLPGWLEKSQEYATMMQNKYHSTESEEALRLRYVLNHLCPSMAHLKFKPIPPPISYVRRDPSVMQEYNDLLREYEFENTQATLVDSTGKMIQDGIHYTAQELSLVIEYVERM